jgi:hypothetical protein
MAFRGSIPDISSNCSFRHKVQTSCEANPEVLKLWGAPPGGRCWYLGGGGRVVCVRYTIILNEIWAHDKIYILVGTLLC